MPRPHRFAKQAKQRREIRILAKPGIRSQIYTAEDEVLRCQDEFSAAAQMNCAERISAMFFA